MSNEPIIEWASDSQAQIQRPLDELMRQGFTSQEPPAVEHFNWLLNLISKVVNRFNAFEKKYQTSIKVVDINTLPDKTLDLSGIQTIFKIAISGPTVINFTNLSNGMITVFVKNESSDTALIRWPNEVLWPNGVGRQYIQKKQIAVFSFICVDGTVCGNGITNFREKRND